MDTKNTSINTPFHKNFTIFDEVKPEKVSLNIYGLKTRYKQEDKDKPRKRRSDRVLNKLLIRDKLIQMLRN